MGKISRRGSNHSSSSLIFRDEGAIGAAGALLNYIRHTQSRLPRHLDNLSLETEQQYIGMDAATRRNLP